MATVTIEMPGQPVGKGRPRFVVRTGHAYTPRKTRTYEEALRQQAKLAMMGGAPLYGPLQCEIQVHIRPPRSWPKWRQKEAIDGIELPASRPDWDNYIKTIDALNAIVWHDDSQVTDGTFIKRYSENPRLVIKVSQI